MVAPDAVAGDLSGGNQQKMVMAKWLAADAEFLLLDDVGDVSAELAHADAVYAGRSAEVADHEFPGNRHQKA